MQFKGVKKLKFDDANEIAKESINDLRKIEAILVKSCFCVVAKLIKEGYQREDVWDYYYSSIRKCLILADEHSKNFTSFLTNQIRWQLLDKYREEKKHKLIRDNRLNEYIDVMHGESIFGVPKDLPNILKKELEDQEQTDLFKG